MIIFFLIILISSDSNNQTIVYTSDIAKLEDEIADLTDAVKRDNELITKIKEENLQKYKEEQEKLSGAIKFENNSLEYFILEYQKVVNARAKQKTQFEEIILDSCREKLSKEARNEEFQLQYNLTQFNYKKMTDELNVNLSNARDLRKAERAHYKSRITDLESQYQLLQSKIEEFEELKETLLAKFGESAPTPTPEVPTFTPLPPILPSDNSNFQKVVQFPHYCCSCTFKSKILIDRTESSSSTNSDETVDDRNKQQNMDLTPEEMIIYEYLLEVMK